MREGSASLSALKALKPDWELAWQQVSQALAQEQGPIGAGSCRSDIGRYARSINRHAFHGIA